MAMTQEDMVFRAELIAIGFAIEEMPADGHCLYHALQTGLHLNGINGGDTMTVWTIRTRIALGIRDHQENNFIQNYFSQEHGIGTDPMTEARIIAETEEWGDVLSVQIAALVWRQNIVVITPPMVFHHFPEEPFQTRARTIYLSYHNNAHYNFLLPDKSVLQSIASKSKDECCNSNDCDNETGGNKHDNEYFIPPIVFKFNATNHNDQAACEQAELMHEYIMINLDHDVVQDAVGETKLSVYYDGDRCPTMEKRKEEEGMIEEDDARIRYPCRWCLVSFGNRCETRTHVENVHGQVVAGAHDQCGCSRNDDNVGIYRCYICERAFVIPALVRLHLIECESKHVIR